MGRAEPSNHGKKEGGLESVQYLSFGFISYRRPFFRMFIQQKQFYWSLLLKNELENQKFAIFGGSLDSFGTKYEKKIVWTYSKEDRVDYAEGMEQSIRIKEHPKSQLISEWNFGVFKSPKNPTKFLTDFFPSFIGQKSV